MKTLKHWQKKRYEVPLRFEVSLRDEFPASDKKMWNGSRCTGRLTTERPAERKAETV